MTLLDAPAFDSRRAKHDTHAVDCGRGGGGGRDYRHAAGDSPDAVVVGTGRRITRSISSMGSVESGDLNKAYGEWNHDANWQQHPAQYQPYGINEFTKDWGPVERLTARSRAIRFSFRIAWGTE